VALLLRALISHRIAGMDMTDDVVRGALDDTMADNGTSVKPLAAAESSGREGRY
jgi:hypothetical protein